MTKERAIPVVRLVGFGLVCSAEIYLVVQLGDRLVPANHFSYFTVLANLFAAVVLGVGVLRSVPDPVRGAAVLYLVVTGVVYAVLLRDVDVDTPAYANWILHVVMPILLVVEWLAAPPGQRISMRQAAVWLVFPVVYLGYTLLRGQVVGWYPYPFLDPRDDGYGAVAVVSAFVAVTIGLLGWAVAWVGNRLVGATPAPPEV